MNGIGHLTFTLCRHLQCVHCKMPLRFDESNMRVSSVISHLRYCTELRNKLTPAANNRGNDRHSTFTRKELRLPSVKEIVMLIQSQNLKCYHLEVKDTPQKCDSQFPVLIFIFIIERC
jgi:hypothetical protein